MERLRQQALRSGLQKTQQCQQIAHANQLAILGRDVRELIDLASMVLDGEVVDWAAPIFEIVSGLKLVVYLIISPFFYFLATSGDLCISKPPLTNHEAAISRGVAITSRNSRLI